MTKDECLGAVSMALEVRQHHYRAIIQTGPEHPFTALLNDPNN